MGVKQLWKLLLPVARRVDIATLSGKVVAVDASIWLIQFVKAMRDSNGDMIMNAHLLGTFRRVCRLLFHRIRPIFVFDGGTPALKRRTVLMRNERREAQGAKLRKAAQRLLMLQFEKTRINARRQKNEEGDENMVREEERGFSAASRKLSSSKAPPSTSSAKAETANDLSLMSESSQEKGTKDESDDFEHAIQMSLETNKGLDKDDDDDEDDEGPVPYQRRKNMRKIESAASVPSPIDLDDPVPRYRGRRLRGNRGRGGNDDDIDNDDINNESHLSLGIEEQGRSELAILKEHLFQAEKAADLADEEAVDKAIKRRRLAKVVVENDDTKENEEEDEASASINGPSWLPLVPSSTKDVDLSVIASLPGYLQKDYISALQTRVRQENRGNLLPMAADPDAFSKTQLSAYLKSSNLNLRIEKMNAEAALKQSDGKRIASEANRQYLLIKEDDQAQAGEVADDGFFSSSSSSSSSAVAAASSGFSASSALVGSGELSDREKAVLFLSRGSASSSTISKRGVTFHSFNGAFTGSGGGLRGGGGGGGGGRGSWRGGRGGRKPAPITLASMSRVRDKRVQGMLDALDPDGAVGKISVGMKALTQPERAAMGLSGLITGESEVGEGGEDEDGMFETEIILTEDGAKLERKIRKVTRSDDIDIIDDDDKSKKYKKKNDESTSSLFRFERGEAESAAAAAAAVTSESSSGFVDPQGIKSEIGESLRVAGITQRGALDYASQFKLTLPTAANAVLSIKKVTEEEEQRLTSSKTENDTSVEEIIDEKNRYLEEVVVIDTLHEDDDDEALAIKMSLESCTGDQLVDGIMDKKRAKDEEDQDEEWEDVTDETLKDKVVTKDEAILQSRKDEALKWLYSDPITVSETPYKADTITNRETIDNLSHQTILSSNRDNSSSSSSINQNSAQQEALASALATASSMASWADSAMRRALKSMHVPVPSQVPPYNSSTSSSSSSSVLPASTLIIAKASHDVSSSSSSTDTLQEKVKFEPPSNQVLMTNSSSKSDDNEDVIDENVDLIVDEEDHDDDVEEEEEKEQLALIMSVQQELLEGETSLPDVPDTIDADSSALSASASSAYEASLVHSFTPPSTSLSEKRPVIAPDHSAHNELNRRELQQQQQQQQQQKQRQAELELERRKKDDAALDSIKAEEARLRLQSGTAARDSDGVTPAMRDEVMALLQLFGVPFVVAPMEAEAQCAALEAAGIVDAVITDDSDAFLFGAKNVFKNIFDDKKYVEVYRADDVEKELGLSRQDLIRAALLLGSDYTSGVKGVGIVNAAEILHAFPGDEGLDSFRTWINELPTNEEEAQGRPSKSLLSTMSRTDRFKALHRTQRRTWEVGTGFPNRAVLAAYRNPTITAIEKAAISWHAPNVEGLRLAAREKFGWPANKTDDLLLPVLHELTSKNKQKTIDSYMKTYADNVHVAAIKSKRLKTAVKGLTGNSDLGVIALADEEDILGVGLSEEEVEDSVSARLERERVQGRVGLSSEAEKTPKSSKKSAKKGKKSKKKRNRIESDSDEIDDAKERIEGLDGLSDEHS